MDYALCVGISLLVGFGLGTWYGSRIKADALAELQKLRNAAANAIKGNG